MIDDLIIIIVSLLFSAFFSGMEIAFVSANKLRIELDRKQGVFASRIISIFTKNEGQYIATMLVGNNIALVVYGFVMGEQLDPVIAKYITTSKATALTIQTIASTFIILITAEYLPKTLFRINPNNTLNIFAIPVIVFYVLFYPVARFSTWISKKLLKRLFKSDEKVNEKKVAFGKIDLDNFLNENQMENPQEDDMHEVKIFQNALEFSKVKLRECIVPRTEIVAIEVEKSLGELKEKFIETGFSKILVYEESIDNIIGYIHSSELFKKPKDIRSRLIELLIVPETMPANKLLHRFIQEHKSLALVVDEFGGTAGMVSIEDIIEEIFGEIEDEHDYLELFEKQISNEEFIFSARLEIDYINEKYNINLPESDDYETLAGLILYNYSSIPKKNEKIEIDNFQFIITEVGDTRIETVNLKITKKT